MNEIPERVCVLLVWFVLLYVVFLVDFCYYDRISNPFHDHRVTNVRLEWVWEYCFWDGHGSRVPYPEYFSSVHGQMLVRLVFNLFRFAARY